MAGDIVSAAELRRSNPLFCLGLHQSIIEPRLDQGLAIDSSDLCLTIQHREHVRRKIHVHTLDHRFDSVLEPIACTFPGIEFEPHSR
jgi:hypothetical protein